MSTAEVAPMHPSTQAEPLTVPTIEPDRLPRHVGIQPDGNGRWAVQRGLPRTDGHVAGGGALVDVIDGALALGIPYLSLHAFSTENWKRPAVEVQFLLDYLAGFLVDNQERWQDQGVRVRWFGQRRHLPETVLRVLEDVEAATADNTALNLQFCLNYGGRAELVDGVKAVARAAAAGALDPDTLDERSFAQYLSDPDIPDVDLFLRSSGEHRLSNFMLWRVAYAEIMFVDTLWPDVDRRDLYRAVERYAKRDRRLGGANTRPTIE